MIGDAAQYIGPIGAGSVAKLVHNCFGYIATAAAAEVFSMGVKAGIEPLAIWEAVRKGAIGRRGAFDLLTDQFLPNKYEPPAFALRLAHKDVSLATALGREVNVPMRLANLALADLEEGLNRGWGDRDSRSMMLCQLERAGIKIEVDPQRLTEALENKTKNGLTVPNVMAALRAGRSVRAPASGHLAPLLEFISLPGAASHHIAQLGNGIPNIDEAHIKWRQTETQHIGRPEIADHPALDQRLHDRVAVRVRECHLAATSRWFARGQQLEIHVPAASAP